MRQLSELEMDEILFQVSRRQLEGYLRELVGTRSPIMKNSKWLQTHEILQRQLFSHGYFVHMHKFRYLNIDGYNVEASMPDDTGLQPNEKLLLTAHYDTVPNSPGADDNASGMAILLEVARILSEKLPELASRVHLVFFDAEEASPQLFRQYHPDVPDIDTNYSIQGLYGSQSWIKDHLSGTTSSWKIKAVLNFESVGYYSSTPNSQQIPPNFPVVIPSVGDFLGVMTTDPGKSMLDLFTSSLADMRTSVKHVSYVVPQKGRLLSDTRRSDHAPFWDAGIPALFITDTGNFRNPHYHQPSDTIDTLDLRMLQRLTKATLLFIMKVFGFVA